MPGLSLDEATFGFASFCEKATAGEPWTRALVPFSQADHFVGERFAWENQGMGLGVYVSVPFCKAKCSFCNFASGVFGDERMPRYVERLCVEMREARAWAERLGAEMPATVETVYLGGGTPSLLPPELVSQVFAGLRNSFEVESGAEMTVECAPGQLSGETLEAMQREGVNRLSFGVQSFVDAECAAVGRMHTGARCREELRRASAAGIERMALDLIVGLPHQSEVSWKYSVEQALESGVEHVSVYMLEVDEESRLGREAIGGGDRYGARALPAEDRVAEWYAMACEWLEAAGTRQYEISNFAREGGESRHNRKYWQREPYMGFGMDAHSMLWSGADGTGGAAPEAVRWANSDSMNGYADRLGEFERTVDWVDRRGGFEESLFLGLRMAEGVSLSGLDLGMVGEIEEKLQQVESAGLVTRDAGRLRLTQAGRMVSNEVFERVLVA